MPAVMTAGMPKKTPVPMRLTARRAGARRRRPAATVEDEGQRGHDDPGGGRPGRRQGGGYIDALLDLLFGELHDQDGVLGRRPTSITSPIWK